MVKGTSKFWVLIFTAALTLNGGAAAQPGPTPVNKPFVTRSLRIPMWEAGPTGLEALLVRPAEPGRYPLAVITHGTPATAQERASMTPKSLYSVALEFARRGWTTVIVMRRGYGESGGRYAESIVSCDYPNYMRPAKESVKDLRAAIDYLSTLPEVDSQRIIAVGHSGGGFAVVALTADPPPGLVGGINFAGGWGYMAADTICQPGGLLSTFWILGKDSRIPMLWVYAQNDHIFKPDLAKSLYEQFTEAGGKATFIAAPAFGDEGHSLFSRTGIPVWTSYVDDFLKAHGLVLRSQLLPLPPVPRIPPPPNLTPSGLEAFQHYLAMPEEKAFALDPGRSWGYDFGQLTLDHAKKSALAHCQKGGAQTCRVVMLNNIRVF